MSQSRIIRAAQQGVISDVVLDYSWKKAFRPDEYRCQPFITVANAVARDHKGAIRSYALGVRTANPYSLCHIN